MKQNTLCIIGARKGSERLPGKNKLEVNGTPLFLNAVAAAQKSGIFADIIFTTDDEDILTDSDILTKEILLHKRPISLADADSTMWQVIDSLIVEYDDIFKKVDGFCILTPCHPFRSPVHIKEAYSIFTKTNADYLMSVSEMPCPHELSLVISDNEIMTDHLKGPIRKGEYPQRYYPNGAVGFVKKEFYMNKNSLYDGKTVPYIMDWIAGLDIDYPKDYVMAKKLEGIISNDSGSCEYKKGV